MRQKTTTQSFLFGREAHHFISVNEIVRATIETLNLQNGNDQTSMWRTLVGWQYFVPSCSFELMGVPTDEIDHEVTPLGNHFTVI